MTSRKPTRPAAEQSAPAAPDAPARFVVQPGHTIARQRNGKFAAGDVLSADEVSPVVLDALLALGAIAPEQPTEE